MADLWQVLLQNLGGRLDEELLPNLYARVGLSAADVRAELTDQGLPFFDPVTGRTPTPGELDAAADEVIRRAIRTATVGGAAAGFAGALALPPEMIAALTQTLRLGQRLAVVYGHDPDTDRGRLLLWRAVAAAWQIKLPTQSAIDTRLSGLPQMLSAQLAELRADVPALSRTLAVRAAVTLGRRTLKMLPGLGAGLSALDARRRMQGQGQRMLPVFRRAHEGVPAIEGPIEDAVEVRKRVDHGPQGR